MTEKKTRVRRSPATPKAEEVSVKKTRIRRTAEQRLVALEQKQSEILERNKALLAKIEAQKQALMNKPSIRKEDREKQKRFERALRVFAPEWKYPHVLAAIELALSEDMARLLERGEHLLEVHGKARKGRRPKKT